MSTATTSSPGRTRRPAKPKLDAVTAAAVETAREALLEVVHPDHVGEYVRAEASGERLVTHVFECTMPGYRGWSWLAVLARAPRAKSVTVCETSLVPGEDALLAPEWEPWADRLRPSDVGADDLLPYRAFDARLEQGYQETDDAEADRVAQWELGLGRERVLSSEGRSEAATRWAEGDFGPRPISKRHRKGTITAPCSSCGFLSLLSGSLRGEFGVCTNEWSPADGRVVHLQYGCGSHSETGMEEAAAPVTPVSDGMVLDELEVDYSEPRPERERRRTRRNRISEVMESVDSRESASTPTQVTRAAGEEAREDTAADASEDAHVLARGETALGQTPSTSDELADPTENSAVAESEGPAKVAVSDATEDGASDASPEPEEKPKKTKGSKKAKSSTSGKGKAEGKGKAAAKKSKKVATSQDADVAAEPSVPAEPSGSAEPSPSAEPETARESPASDE